MAAWQFDVEVVPSGLATVPIEEPWADIRPPENWEDLVGGIFPPARSWSPDHLRTWGVEDSHRIDAWVDDGRLRSILVRLDARQENCEMIALRIAELASSLGAKLRTRGGLVIEPEPGALAGALEGSAAMRFVQNPELFLRRLRIGGIDDA